MSDFPETLGNAIVAEMNYTGADGERVYVTADLFRMSVVEERDKKTVQYFWNKGHREDKRSVCQFLIEHVKEYPLMHYIGIPSQAPSIIQQGFDWIF